MKKKVLILHATAGSGHTKAAQAIYTAFGELEHNLDVKIVNVLDYMTLFFRWTYPRIYVFLVNRIPLIWGFCYYILDNKYFYSVVSWIRHLVNWANSRRLARFLQEEQPGVIINTHFVAPDVVTMAGKKKIKGHLITVITDYRLHSFWIAGAVDTYVVSYEETKRELVKRGIPAKKILVLGMPVDPIFSKNLDKQAIQRKLGIRDDQFTVLVGSGGFGIGPVERLVKEIIGVDLPLQLLVVCGKNKTLLSAVKKLSESAKFPVIAFGFVDNMYELMDVADLIVTKSGGMVCAEALAKNLPIVGIFPIPGQESRNLGMLTKYGVGSRLNQIKEIKNILKEYCNNQSNSEIVRRKIKEIKRPNASRDIARFAIDILKS